MPTSVAEVVKLSSCPSFAELGTVVRPSTGATFEMVTVMELVSVPPSPSSTVTVTT